MAGGAAGAATGAAIGYTDSYALTVGLNENVSWNTGDYFRGLGTSVGLGAVGGALGGARSYGLNPNAVNQHIIKWGYEHEKFGQTISFVQKTYNIEGNFAYSPFAPSEVPNARGNTQFNKTGSGSYIYKNAFLNPNTHQFDPTSIIQVMSHESFHQTTSVLEFGAYQYNLLNAGQQRLSSGIMDYAYKRMVDEYLKTPIQALFSY